jgi:hypothetical protein
MESANAFNIATLTAIVGMILALMAFSGGVLYRVGVLSNRVEQLGSQISEMREENRHNHQQLLQALAHHTHDPDTGFAIFRIPPGTENPAV